MCGIFGFFKKNLYTQINEDIFSDFTTLLKLTSQRGADKSGFCFFGKNENHVHKEDNYVDTYINSKSFRCSINKILNNIETHGFFGQTRLPIIGDKQIPENNFPIETKYLLGLHNGNFIFDQLDFNNLEFSEKSDSRIFFENLSENFPFKEDEFENYLLTSVRELKGDFNIVIYLKSRKFFYLASNTGSIYYINSINNVDDYFLFMSERFFIEQFLKKSVLINKYGDEIFNLKNKILKIDNNFSLTQRDL